MTGEASLALSALKTLFLPVKFEPLRPSAELVSILIGELSRLTFNWPNLTFYSVSLLDVVEFFKFYVYPVYYLFEYTESSPALLANPFFCI